jgi:hypothetical protein
MPRSIPKRNWKPSSRKNGQNRLAPRAGAESLGRARQRLAQELADLWLEHEEWKAASMERYGWYAHYVFPTGDPAVDGDLGLEPGLPKGFFNSHTHGFPEKFGVPDVQLVLPLKVELAHGIFWAIHNRYAGGPVLAIGVPVERVLENFPVILVPAMDKDRAVHRIVLPDPQGRFWDDPDCEPLYKAQVNGVRAGFIDRADEGRASR